MALGRTIREMGEVADKVAREVLKGGSRVLSETARNMVDVPACTAGDGIGGIINKARKGLRVALVVMVPSVSQAQHSNSDNGMESDRDPENGTVVDASVGLSPMDNEAPTDDPDKPCLSPGPNGTKQVNGTCIFTARDPNGGNKFKFEFQGADALMDTDLNVQLRIGAVREVAGTSPPPQITVCGTDHCMTAQSQDVGWVLKEGEDQVVVMSEQGESLVKTTFTPDLKLKDGEWVRIDLQNPEGSENGESPSCSIRWSNGNPENSAYLLAAMASLLYLSHLRKRKKNGLKREKRTAREE